MRWLRVSPVAGAVLLLGLLASPPPPSRTTSMPTLPW